MSGSSALLVTMCRVYQCRSVAEAEWFAKELDRALGEERKHRMAAAD
jgi:hypothetical protein